MLFPQAQLSRRILSTVVLCAVILLSSSPEPLATMVTTSAASLALQCHAIPLVSAYNEKAEGSQVSLSHYINLGDGTKEKRKYNVPLVNTQDVETLCCCILEFEDVSVPPHLSLTTGPLKFSFFQQCLGGTIHNQWDTLADGLNETMANFTNVQNNLIAGLVHLTDLADQRHYLEMSKKPYRLNCASLTACIEIINKMMSLFPGAAGNPPMQPVDVKNLFYQMMPAEWQQTFLNSGQVITNNDYTLLALQHFMTLQEEQNQADVARRHHQQQRVGRQRTGRQGRSPGRRYPAGDGGAASPHCQSSGTPFAVPLAQQAPAAAQAFYRGFPRPPYQGQHPYQGQAYHPYHPYQRAPGAAQGCGRGRGRGPEIFQAQTPNLPPAIAAPNRPDGNPPNKVHFTDDPYGQEAFLPEPPFECWVTGYSHDLHPPMDENKANKYDYAPEHSYEANTDQSYDYCGGEDEECPNKSTPTLIQEHIPLTILEVPQMHSSLQPKTPFLYLLDRSNWLLDFTRETPATHLYLPCGSCYQSNISR